MLMAIYTIRRILVDNDSSADILFYETFSKMEISQDRLLSCPTPLRGSLARRYSSWWP